MIKLVNREICYSRSCRLQIEIPMILVFSQQLVLFALSTNIIRLLWGAVLVPALSHRSGQFLIGPQHKRFSEGLVQCSKEGLALVQDGVTEDFSMSIWRDKSMENNFGYGGFLHAKALFLIKHNIHEWERLLESLESSIR